MNSKNFWLFVIGIIVNLAIFAMIYIILNYFDIPLNIIVAVFLLYVLVTVRIKIGDWIW